MSVKSNIKTWSSRELWLGVKIKDRIYAAGKEGEHIKHAKVYYPQLTLITSLVRCKMKKISGLGMITYGKNERFSQNTAVLWGKEIPEGHDLVFSSPGVEVKSWKRKKKTRFPSPEFSLELWERKLTGHGPTLPGWAGSLQLLEQEAQRSREPRSPLSQLALCHPPGLTRNAFLRLHLGLHGRCRVARPVAHSALAWDLNKNKLQVLTVIDGLLLHLCRVFLLKD